jgi:hypothetical protein
MHRARRCFYRTGVRGGGMGFAASHALQRASDETAHFVRQLENFMKGLNALANREFLVLVAIVASAVTLHVRQHVTPVSVPEAVPSHAQFGRMCAPSSSSRSGSGDGARALPADCELDRNVSEAGKGWV